MELNIKYIYNERVLNLTMRDQHVFCTSSNTIKYHGNLFYNNPWIFLPPLVPKEVMMSVKKVRKRGEVAAKYVILTVLSSLLVSRTRKTSKGTTKKL